MLAHLSETYGACLSLKQSQGCPGFAGEYISTNATSRFSWYPKDDINAFDKALNDYVNGQSNLEEFQSVFRCPGLDDLGGFNTDHGKSVIRYHRSMVCADLLFSDENINDCYGSDSRNHRRRDVDEDNAGLELAKVVASSSIGVRPPMPKPLCRTTCNTWVDSLHAIISNTTLCQASKGNNRESSLESLRTKCHTDVYNGTPGNCVDGNDNELRTCGYQRVEDWCKYCRYAVDYQDTCESIGVRVGKDADGPADGPSVDSPSDDDEGDVTADDHNDTNKNLVAALEKQSRQERLFRIVAIVLSVAVGIFLLFLVIAIATGHGIGNGEARRKLFPNRGDSVLTLGSGGSNGEEASEKTVDFVDCFIANAGKPRQVVRHFFARREDEISLQQGDIVTLQMAFDDGWVVGKNLTTGGEGTFPLMCVMESVPATVPAQWSVLPESKATSSENIRPPGKAATGRRGSPHASLLGSMSLPASLDGPPSLANNASRISNLSATGRQGTRSARVDASGNELVARDGGSARTLLGRLLDAFVPGNAGSVRSSSSSSDGQPGFFRRLTPFGGRDKQNTPPSPKDGRPHSFNVKHVVHVGLASPNYPRPGDLNISVPTFPTSTNGPSLNGYPVMTGGGSQDYAPVTSAAAAAAARVGDTQMPSSQGFVRPPNFGYGEFAPPEAIHSANLGNSSVDTYQTAEQFGMSAAGMHAAATTARNPS
ncbi:hypothetical protein LPJ53_001714 [Coemansia erecta]|uniref:SH3 domain-containing protein n=1 Tax=Coemansia erecta TaxID=147472 RepID=A0A9W8CU83_9FUNG|nr:hypothetical protein LPJ53_001714 [Coemansia erecta]